MGRTRTIRPTACNIKSIRPTSYTRVRRVRPFSFPPDLSYDEYIDLYHQLLYRGYLNERGELVGGGWGWLKKAFNTVKKSVLIPTGKAFESLGKEIGKVASPKLLKVITTGLTTSAYTKLAFIKAGVSLAKGDVKGAGEAFKGGYHAIKDNYKNVIHFIDSVENKVAAILPGEIAGEYLKMLSPFGKISGQIQMGLSIDEDFHSLIKGEMPLKTMETAIKQSKAYGKYKKAKLANQSVDSSFEKAMLEFKQKKKIYEKKYPEPEAAARAARVYKSGPGHTYELTEKNPTVLFSQFENFQGPVMELQAPVNIPNLQTSGVRQLSPHFIRSNDIDSVKVPPNVVLTMYSAPNYKLHPQHKQPEVIEGPAFVGKIKFMNDVESMKIKLIRPQKEFIALASKKKIAERKAGKYYGVPKVLF